MKLPRPRDLKQTRKNLGLSQSDVAQECGLSRPSVSKIENGKTDPRLSTLREICSVLNETSEKVTARSVMTKNVISIAPDEQISTAVDRMFQHGVSQMPVLEDSDSVGSISYTEVVKGLDTDKTAINEFMTKSLPTVPPEKKLIEVNSILNHSSAVLVESGDDIVGVITESDIANSKLETIYF